MNQRTFALLLVILHCFITVLQAEPSPEVQMLLTQAQQGDLNAQRTLAFRYRDGNGVPRDYSEALRWGHLAADRGDAAARDFVGHMFLTGWGVKQNPKIAAGYFQAAAGESVPARWNLGQCYFGAQGVEQDIPKALELWKQAADLGHGRSASTAAMVYLSGEGVPQDLKLARQLTERAAELNDPNGLVVLGELQFQAGEFEAARATWQKVASTKKVGPTGQPEQPSDQLAAQQGADLLKLMEYRQQKPQPGKFALVPVSHVHQGYNNCGAAACTAFARFQGAKIGAWDFKRLCPSPLGTGTDWDHLVQAGKKIGQTWKLITFPADDAGFEQATAFLQKELDAGRPVVIDFKYIGPQYPNGAAGHTLGAVGYLAEEKLYVLCNPAIPTPGLQLMTAADLQRYWRSDGYSHLSKGVLSRPAIVMER